MFVFTRRSGGARGCQGLRGSHCDTRQHLVIKILTSVELEISPEIILGNFNDSNLVCTYLLAPLPPKGLICNLYRIYLDTTHHMINCTSQSVRGKLEEG